MEAEKAQKSPSRSASVSIHAVGRRKSAVARVWISRGNGKITVNGKNVDSYFTTDVQRLSATFPFKLFSRINFNAEVNVQGGGLNAQADAAKLGIARALLIADEQQKVILREHGLLTVDARVKERKKYGQKAARRRFQFVKR